MVKELTAAHPEQYQQAAIIRSIQPSDDIHALWDIHVRAMKNEHRAFNAEKTSDYKDFDDLYHFYKQRKGDFLIAEIDGKIVGFGAFMEYVEPTIVPTCYFRRLRVDPDYQNRGIGQQLIKERESRASDMGYQAARVITTSQNKAALHVLMKNGFTVIKETPTYDKEHDAEVVEYLLEKYL